MYTSIPWSQSNDPPRGETNEHFHLLIFQLSVELLPHIDGLPRSQILTLARQIMQKMQYVGMVKAELLVT